jgi:hypothetical protein
MSNRTLKDMLNDVLGQSSFLQRDAFATSTDPDNIQMVAFANHALDEHREAYPWNRLRESDSITLIANQLVYDLADDFDWYLTETMWKAYGARHVVIPTTDRYWAFLKAGNPGSALNYYAKFIQGKLEFTSVAGGDVINYDYISENSVRDVSGTMKPRFTADTDTYLLPDTTLVLGIKAYWQLEKEMNAGAIAMKDFLKNIKRDIGKDTPAKSIRTPNSASQMPFSPPIDKNYLW